MDPVNRALILMYHLVDAPRSAQEHRFCTPTGDFERQMDHLAAKHTPIALRELFDCVAGARPWPARPVHVTFDDGFAGVLEHAAPILAKRHIPATLFAVSDRIGKTNDWMSSRGFPERRLLNVAQLRELQSLGFAIGSHTRTHARLTDLDPRRVREEVATSKSTLEDALGRSIAWFAYPYGLANAAVRDIVVEAGYDGACSTVPGFNRAGQDPFMLRRIDVFGTDRFWQFRQKLRYGHNEAKRLFAVKYYAGRVGARLRGG